MSATLHYIFDPLCGWCYGAEPLAHAAAEVPGLTMQLHAGGLWPEPTVLPEHMRSYINEADGRLAQLTGQPLGETYRKELLFDPNLVLDSAPVTRAVLAAEQLAGQGLNMLRAIQHAHYVDGRHVVRDDVLQDLGAKLGLDADEFAAAMQQTDTATHISDTRHFMAQIGAQGFPAFVLELNGSLHGVDHNRFHRNAEGFAGWIAEAVKQSAH